MNMPVKNRKGKKLRAVLLVSLLSLALLLGGAALWAQNGYRADGEAVTAMAGSRAQGELFLFEGGSDTGLIFYPGGRVEYAAYGPLMARLAEQGISCVLVQMPLQLAFLDAGAWERALALAPDVENWYLGGHSLGGVAAASALDEDIFRGLILLGSYPANEVSVPSLSLWGDRDGVMDREKYEEGKKLLADDTEIILEGGNHAFFGSYGPQSGDGTALISREEQQNRTAEEILAFIKAHN